MNICNISSFRDALSSPRTKFHRLHDIKADMESIYRTTHFAECHAMLNNTPVILYAPISIDATALLHHASLALNGRIDTNSTRMKILHDEIEISAINNSSCLIAIEYLQSETTLHDVIPFGSRQRLLQAIDDLESRLKALDISHNNLTPQNLTIDNKGHLHPIRQYYTTRGFGGDNVALDKIREIIRSETPDDQFSKEELVSNNTVCDNNSSYTTSPRLRAVIEGRRAISRESLWGFEDEAGNEVIRAQYSYVSDFAENRAMVADNRHMMGLIDRDGNMLIPVIYEVVEYDCESGNSWVRNNNQWALFDYNGMQITDWHDRDECNIEL